MNRKTGGHLCSLDPPKEITREDIVERLRIEDLFKKHRAFYPNCGCTPEHITLYHPRRKPQITT